MRFSIIATVISSTAAVSPDASAEETIVVPLGTYAGKGSWDGFTGSTSATVVLKSADKADFKFVSDWSGYESAEPLEGQCDDVGYSVSARNPPAYTLHLGGDDECIQSLIDKWNGQITNAEYKISASVFNFLYSAGNDYIDAYTSFGGYNFLLNKQPSAEIEMVALVREDTVYPAHIDDVEDSDATTQGPAVEEVAEASETTEAPTADASNDVPNSGVPVEEEAEASETTEAPAVETDASNDVPNSTAPVEEDAEDADDEVAQPESTSEEVVENDEEANKTEADVKGDEADEQADDEDEEENGNEEEDGDEEEENGDGDAEEENGNDEDGDGEDGENEEADDDGDSAAASEDEDVSSSTDAPNASADE